MNFTLPKAVTIDGEEHEIRYDYRVALDIISMLNDPDLGGSDKAEALMQMFYVHPERIRNIEEAIKQCYGFIDQGKPGKKGPRTMDWEQDFEYIVGPVNRVLGRELREIEYDTENNRGGLHWWTFLAAYMEIGGDCLFSQIVSIRDKLARGEKLEKTERKWLNENRGMILLKKKYSQEENEELDKWIKGGE